MHLKLVDVHTNAIASIIVTHGTNTITFNVSEIITKRFKVEELNEAKQFDQLNEFISRMTISDQKELFNRYKKLYESIYAVRHDYMNTPTGLFNPILDMFKLEDVKAFILDTSVIPRFPETFDVNAGNGMKINREQTYLRDEYTDLISLAMIMKSILCGFGELSHVHKNKITSIHMAHYIYIVVKSHKIANSKPFLRLAQFIDKTIEKDTQINKQSPDIRVIEKSISKDFAGEYLFATILVSRLAAVFVGNDTVDKNIIKVIYNYISGKLRNRGDVTNKIRNKTSGTESAVEDKSSPHEVYRIVADLNEGTKAEYNANMTHYSHNITKHLLKPIDNTVLKYITDVVNTGYAEQHVSEEQVTLIKYLLKDIINPKAFSYILKPGVLNGMSICFAYLWALDFKYLAILLISTVVQTDLEDDDVLVINNNVHKQRIKQHHKDGLHKYFPNEKIKNKVDTVNLGETLVSDLSKAYFDSKRMLLIDDKYTKEVLGEGMFEIPSDLKIQFSELIIEIEEKRVAKYVRRNKRQ